MSEDPKKFTPAMPVTRPPGISVYQRIKLARQDIFSSITSRLYTGWMAQQRFFLYDGFLINDPDLVKLVLLQRSQDFPKTRIMRDSLYLLLGDSVFVTNGEVWKRQRRIVDQAFEGGKLRDTFPAMVDAGNSCVARLKERATGEPVEIEYETGHCAADVIFRTLFSRPIKDEKAEEIFFAFRDFQATHPMVNVMSLLKTPSWMPRFHSRKAVRSAKTIRRLITAMTRSRRVEIKDGTAPDDLATKIMTTPDAVTGKVFDTREMVDQVAVFFLAGHETSAAALAWSLYMLASCPEIQDRAAAEARAAWETDPTFSDMRSLPFIRDVFREALRLYPPAPMIIRDAAKDEVFRERKVKKGSVITVSPWFLQRHDRIWDQPNVFDPDRWSRPETKETARKAYVPFSSGERVCPGAGFAMLEGVLLLAIILRDLKFEAVEGAEPQPILHLTVHSKDGIYLKVTPRPAD